jgi:hypothetical protein
MWLVDLRGLDRAYSGDFVLWRCGTGITRREGNEEHVGDGGLYWYLNTPHAHRYAPACAVHSHVSSGVCARSDGGWSVPGAPAAPAAIFRLGVGERHAVIG